MRALSAFLQLQLVLFLVKCFPFKAKITLQAKLNVNVNDFISHSPYHYKLWNCYVLTSPILHSLAKANTIQTEIFSPVLELRSTFSSAPRNFK